MSFRKMPPCLQAKCQTALAQHYPTVRFDFELDHGCNDLQIDVRGSQEDLTRSGLMSAEAWAIVPPCGVSQSVPHIFKVQRLSKCWRLQIHSFCFNPKGSKLHSSLMATMREAAPELDEWMRTTRDHWHREHGALQAARTNPPTQSGEAGRRMLRSARKIKGTEIGLKSRVVGRFQRQVHWMVEGNVIAPNWIDVQAHVIVARGSGRS